MERESECKVSGDVKDVTPVSVRDAILECFLKAHKGVLNEERDDVKSGDSSTQRFEVESLIRKMFAEIGGNYDRPTRETLIMVVDSLKEYASHFRDKKIIEKNAAMIMALINKLED